MHPPTDSSDHGTEISTAPPAHTLVSIALMLLIAAGVLAGMRALYQDRAVVFRQWDFAAIAPEAGPWAFPEEERTKTDRGIAYVAQGTGPGPVLTHDFDAGQVGRIRIRIEVTRVEDGTPIPYVAEWYWASPEDVAAAAGAWPFSEERGTVFVETNRHQPDLRELDLREETRWRGKIAKSFIGIKLPGSAVGPYRIETRRIEFLE